MKKELSSGIKEFDELIYQFENGEINFVNLTSKLWNGGYRTGQEDMEDRHLNGSIINGKCDNCGKPMVPEFWEIRRVVIAHKI